MRKPLLAVAALAAALWTAQAVTACVGDAPAVSDGGVARACGKGTECPTGFCTDGVCCDTACGGSCEACNVAGSAGTCSPVPAGEDPDKECATTALDGGGIPDDAAFTPPDGGIVLNEARCAGACNGKRACGFPDRNKSCGTVFCSSTTTQGRAACDNQGHCQLGFETCVAYSCPDGTGDAGAANGCLAACTSEADCLPTHYCDQGTCKPKLANGTTCKSVPQCQSAHCVNTVCCNDECQILGGSCTSTGNVGQCTCSACTTGACKLWYKDGDGDGFGDSTGTLGNGRAMTGCASGPDGGAPTPPAPGFVQDNTDCFDALAVVHPGQTGFFTAPYGNNSFDYNCDNLTTKESAEAVGQSCGFCAGNLITCTKNTTCFSANQQASNGCNFKCLPASISAFHVAVACGASASYYTCGTCSVANSVALQTVVTKAQACH
jgi:hypothetical protein